MRWKLVLAGVAALGGTLAAIIASPIPLVPFVTGGGLGVAAWLLWRGTR